MREKSFASKIYLEKTVEKIEKKIKLLGIHCDYDATTLLNYRLFVCLLIFMCALILSEVGYILGPILVLIFHFGSEYFVLDYKIKKRTKLLEENAIFFFEVLSLTLESGRNLVSALQLTSKNVSNELAEEFQKSLSEMQLGHSFSECMNKLKTRIPSETINNAILNIVQASQFGNDIEVSLNNQLDYLREKQLLDIKSEISKLPTKISIISVIFFIPIILFVILAPVLIDFLVK